MTRTRGTHAQTGLASYSRDFYRDLAALSGVDVGYYPNGSLSLARTPERLTELRYGLTLARHHGLPARELSLDEIAAVSPLLSIDGLTGGVLFEEDATVNPGWAAWATAKAAHELGVRVLEAVRVTGFRLEATTAGLARVTGVETDHGVVECEVAVLAAGLWTRDLALLAGARVPLHPAEHYWAQTGPVDGATRDLPIIRDLDGSVYIRHYRGGLLVGAFEPDGRPRTAASIPDDFSFGEFEPDLEHFARPLAAATQRVPALTTARFEHYLCAPESFTPDGDFLLGETAEVAGLFVAAGMNSQGIILGPGVGLALARWIDEGAPSIDAAEVDVRRFAPAQANAGYLFERTRESLGRLYAMHWPFRQPETAGGLRRVPLYDRLAAAGAVFGEAAGWERADWYARPGDRPAYEYSFGRQNWWDAVAEEHLAAREGVALFDLSSFAKMRVEGPGALASLQRVFTADLDRPPGSVVYTALLNQRGGLELDATVTRLEEGSFLVVTSATAQTRLHSWLRRFAGPAVVTDVTSGLAVLSVTGPRSRELLAGLTGSSLADADFPFARARTIDVGWAPVLAVRVSFTGELGWELYVPVESAPVLYDQLVEAGRALGLRHAGYRALDGLRAEKGFIHWGADAGPADRPDEAGLAATVAMDKPGGFIGREALAAGGRPSRRLVPLLLDDPEPLLYHGETVLQDGRIVGRVTSGAYGHTLGAAVGLAAVQGEPAIVDEVVAGGAVDVEIAARRYPAHLSARPFYDPDGRRLRRV
jgi:glycine cleavage system aminomethyltransferase T/glycine/D-amino acid oxidase-like deaminating enzyme